jgi:hypothetical protein
MKFLKEWLSVVILVLLEVILLAAFCLILSGWSVDDESEDQISIA